MWPFVYVVCSRCHHTDGHAGGHSLFLIVSMEVSEMAEGFLCSYIFKHSFHVKIGVRHIRSFKAESRSATENQPRRNVDFIVIVNMF